MTLRTLSITEAMQATGISRDTLYVLCETGQITANRNRLVAKSRWRISEDSLQAWIHRATPPPAAAPAPRATNDEQAFREKFPEMPDERVFG